MLKTIVASVAVLACNVAAVTASKKRVPLNPPKITPYKSARLEMSQPGYPPAAPGQKQQSGYFTINRDFETRYFSWLVEAQESPETAPLVFFFSGGPGCSSGLGMVGESFLPFTATTGGKLKANPYPWTKFATVIGVDQPAGVGYSTTGAGGAATDLKVVADDMYVYFQNFFKANPQYKNNKVFIFGESFGGAYVPEIAHRLWLGARSKDIDMTFGGVEIGNGLISGPEQFNTGYYELAYNWCIKNLGKPCISESAYAKMKQTAPKCQEMAKACQANISNIEVCANAGAYCQNTQMGPYQESNENGRSYCFYNIKQPSGCADASLGDAEAFFNTPEVQKSLTGQDSINYQACNYTVNSMLLHSWMFDRSPLIAQMLDDDVLPVRFLIMNGLLDFAVNWIGNLATINNIQWSGQQNFTQARKQDWFVTAKDEPAGWFKTSDATQKLTFAGVFSAGHMVPADQPEAAQQLVKTFTTGSGLWYNYVGPENATD